MDRVGGTGEGVFVLDLNSLSRSETSINLLRAIWKAVIAILTIARVTFFRCDEDLAFSSGVGGSTDMPGQVEQTTCCYHFQRTLKKNIFLGQNLLVFAYVE